MAWYFTDKQGSVTDLMDSTQALRDHLDYTGYGVVTESNPSFGDAYKYNGGRFDNATGLVQFGKRWYNPSTGAWTSQDPLQFDGGQANLYEYVGNGPTNAIDPSGLAPIKGDITIIGNATSSAEKGKLTPKGGKEFESTDADLKARKAYYMQYDGPTEFTAEYTITLKADKSVDPSKSTIQFTTVYYTSRSYTTRRDAAVTKEDEEKLIKQGKSVYRDGENAYIFGKPRKTPSDWKSLPIPITEVTLNKDCSVESFKFKSDTWYPDAAKFRIVDKGLSGAVDIKTGTATFTGKYQSASTAVIATYVVTGKIK